MITLTLTKLSDHEYALGNDYDLTIFYDNKPVTIPASHTLFFEDAGGYDFTVIQDENYASSYHTVAVAERLINDGASPNRVVINKQVQLAHLKRELCRQVDERAGDIRSGYITTVEGQDMVYQRKASEARAYLVDTQIAEIEIPHLVLEAQALGVTVADVANGVVAQEEAWAQLSAQIEAIRVGSKAQINAAQTIAEAEDAAGVVDWSSVL